MTIAQAMFMSAGPQLLLCDSADFDGTNDYMTRGAGLTGAADSKSGIFSGWIRIDGGDAATLRILYSINGSVNVFRSNTNVLRIVAENSTGTTILTLPTVNTYTTSATWRHILASWNLASAAGHLYINDVSDLGATTLTDNTIDYTVTEWTIGAEESATFKFNGCLAEIYFAPGQFLDFSIVANRRKFISSSGKPVFLGTDGSSPTGTAPIVYQRVADGAAVATFATNLGSGGNFSITGTLETGSTSPSD